MPLSEIFARINYFIHYQLTAGYWKGHGIHSPFLFDFVRNVIFDKSKHTEFERIKNARRELLHSAEKLQVFEFGARSAKMKEGDRTVKQLAKNAATSEKYGRLLFRMVQHYKPLKIVELGTSLGVGSLYMALGSPKCQLITLEGNKSLHQFAQQFLTENNITNCEYICGLFDDILLKESKRFECPDLVYIDGNHRLEPTLRYFDFFVARMEKGIIVIDDIHWSREMHSAWRTLVQKNKSFLLLDLYQFGIIIKMPQLTPGHFRIRY